MPFSKYYFPGLLSLYHQGNVHQFDKSFPPAGGTTKSAKVLQDDKVGGRQGRGYIEHPSRMTKDWSKRVSE